MKRTRLDRKIRAVPKEKPRNAQQEQKILDKVQLTLDGEIIYPGQESEEKRTGSNIYELIDWYLYRKGETKPFDEKVFADYMKTLKL